MPEVYWELGTFRSPTTEPSCSILIAYSSVMAWNGTVLIEQPWTWQPSSPVVSCKDELKRDPWLLQFDFSDKSSFPEAKKSFSWAISRIRPTYSRLCACYREVLLTLRIHLRSSSIRIMSETFCLTQFTKHSPTNRSFRYPSVHTPWTFNTPSTGVNTFVNNCVVLASPKFRATK